MNSTGSFGIPRLSLYGNLHFPFPVIYAFLFWTSPLVSTINENTGLSFSKGPTMIHFTPDGFVRSLVFFLLRSGNFV
jgi:hypothetical protein